MQKIAGRVVTDRRMAMRSSPELPAAPAVQPVMRRWPHPVAVHPAPEGLAAELHYISCALSQQTRQLDEIRCLLKRLANSAGSE